MDINLILKDPESGFTKDLVSARNDLLRLNLPRRLIRISKIFPVNDSALLSEEIEAKFFEHKNV